MREGAFIAMRRIILSALWICGHLLAQGQVLAHGVFYGTLQLQPVGDGVHMQVLQAYSYSDLEGHLIGADKGFVTDGASIPKLFWSVIGGPFDGKYVGAAVIHDVGCVSHKYTWQVTDRMFYYAMLDLDVDTAKAKIMYWAVRKFGPHWETKIITADTDELLQQKIKDSNPIQITETSGTTARSPKKAVVVIQLPSPPVSAQQAQAIEKEVTGRESSAHPMTIQEIDDRTNEAGSRP
jgi:hypothetical protein